MNMIMSINKRWGRQINILSFSLFELWDEGLCRLMVFQRGVRYSHLRKWIDASRFDGHSEKYPEVEGNV